METKVTRVKLASLKFDPAFEPPHDEVLAYLCERAAVGGVPVFFASVPLGKVRPFSETFHPENHPKGRDIVEAIMANWRAGRFSYFWVYERGDSFIVSDDYFSLAAARRGQPDCLPCWILGQPVGDLADLQGPLVVADVRKALGLGE